MKIKTFKKIVISRTDSIGDVALTLPLAGILREKYPDAHIVFLGNTYTKPVIECVDSIDEVWCWADIQALGQQQQVFWLKEQNVDVFIHVFPRKELAKLAKKAGIAHRIGTLHRLFHLFNCNHRTNFSRKKSDLHEAQLNTKLLKPLDLLHDFSLSELAQYAQLRTVNTLDDELKSLIDSKKKQVILHPKSKGSALEWGVDKFIALAASLPADKYQVFFSGTQEESAFFSSKLPDAENIIDLSGKMTLEQLIAFIGRCHILVAASTGPLHIAGLSNIKTIGLFSEQRPLHPGRWMPLGKQVTIITQEPKAQSTSLLNISVERVKSEILAL